MGSGILVFEKETHTYRLDGKIIPSVSQIVSRITGNTYKDVPKHILEKASEFGTSVHEMIELFNETGEIESCMDKDKIHCLDGWRKAKKQYGLEVIHSELMFHYKGQYAGTLDCLARMMKQYNILIDYKTTSKFYKDSVTYQLNLYRMGVEHMMDLKIDAMGGMWLPKRDVPDLIPIKRLDNKILESYL